MCSVNHKNLPTNYIDSYITLDYKIHMVFDRLEDCDIIFYTYLDNIKKYNSNYSHHVEDDDEIVITFNIPSMYHSDFDKFTQGKYSQFDELYKRVIVRFFGMHTIKDNYEVTEYNVIYPQEFKRRQIAERLYDKKDVKSAMALIQEVLDPPDMERESFKPLQQLLQENNQLTETNTQNI